MATIRQVAAKAKVSAMTVSNVLRGVEGACAPATRERVLRAVEALGYRANALPKAMRSGVFNVVALVVGEVGGFPWVSLRMVDALHKALDQAGKHLLLCKVDERRLATDGPDRAPRLIRETHADGVLINGMGQASADRIAAAMRQYPTVYLNQRRPVDAVYPDDRAAGAAAYAYLRRCGCRRPAYVTLYGGAHSSMPERRQGFLEAAAGASVQVLAPAAGVVTEPGSNLPSLAVCALALEADGICCYTTGEAEAICRLAQERGLDPARLRLVTFNEVPFACGPWQVATYLLPMAEIGRLGVTMLLRRLAGAGPCPSEVLAVPLHEPPWAW